MGLTGLLASGMQGIEQKLVLRPALRTEKGVESESMPGSLPEALLALENDEFLCGIFGSSLIRGHLALRRHEAERASHMALEDEITEWLSRA